MGEQSDVCQPRSAESFVETKIFSPVIELSDSNYHLNKQTKNIFHSAFSVPFFLIPPIEIKYPGQWLWQKM